MDKHHCRLPDRADFSRLVARRVERRSSCMRAATVRGWDIDSAGAVKLHQRKGCLWVYTRKGSVWSNGLCIFFAASCIWSGTS